MKVKCKKTDIGLAPRRMFRRNCIGGQFRKSLKKSDNNNSNMASFHYGSTDEGGRRTKNKSRTQVLVAIFGLSILVLAAVAAFGQRAAVTVLDDDYHETDKVYPLESSENDPPGTWSGDTGAESSDQYPVESSEEDPIGEWHGDTGAEPSGQYPQESEEIPIGEWTGDTGAEPSGQYPAVSEEITLGDWTGDTGGEPSGQYPAVSEMSDQYPIVISDDR